MLLPVAGIQFGILDRVAAVQKHRIACFVLAYIEAHMGNPRRVIGAYKEHQITGLGCCYRGRNVVKPLRAQPPRIAKAAVCQHIADKAAAIKGGSRTAAAPE